MSRREASIYFDPAHLTPEEARRLSIDSHAADAGVDETRDNRAFSHLGQHRLVVGDISVHRDAHGQAIAPSEIPCISASVPQLTTDGSGRLSLSERAFREKHYIAAKRMIALAETRELVISDFGIDDASLAHVPAAQHDAYRKAAVCAWYQAWNEHQTAAVAGNPTELVCAFGGNPFVYGSVRRLQRERPPHVAVNISDPVDYCLQDAGNRTLVNASSPRAIGGDYLAQTDQADLARRTISREAKLAVRSNLVDRHTIDHNSGIAVGELPDGVQTAELLRDPTYTQRVSLMHSYTDSKGELYIALRHGQGDASQWTLPTRDAAAGQTVYDAARRALSRITSEYYVHGKHFQAFGLPSTTNRDRVERIYLREHASSSQVLARDSVEYVKVSDLVANDQHKGRQVKASHLARLRDLYAQHSRERAFTASAWALARTSEERPDYVVVTTSGSGNDDCFGAAFGETLLAHALQGDAGEQWFFQNDCVDGRNKLFRALTGQASNVDDLYSVRPVTNLVNATRVQDFAALAALATPERQARFGHAMRQLFANELDNELRTVLIPANRHLGNSLIPVLQSDFELFMEDGTNPGDAFREMQFVIDKFTALSARIRDDSDTLTQDGVAAELETWWHAQGYRAYINEVKQPNVYLGAFAGQVLARVFSVQFQYKEPDSDALIDGSDELPYHPKLQLHYNGTDHWSAYMPSDMCAVVRNAAGDAAQIHVAADLTEEDNRRADERAAQSLVSTLTHSVGAEEFYRSVEAYYGDTGPTERPYGDSDYLEYDESSRTLRTRTGLTLTITSREPFESGDLSSADSDGGVPSASSDAGEDASAMLVITASEYITPDGNLPLSEHSLQLEKLRGIACAYADAFVADGMPRDELQIDITRIGELWDGQEKEVINAFKRAGFVRILIHGKEVHNDIAKRRQAKREEKRRAEVESQTQQAPTLVERLGPEPAADSNALAVARQYPKVTAGVAMGAGAAFATALYNEHPLVAAGIVAATTLSTGAVQAYQRGLVHAAAARVDALRVGMPERSEAMQLVLGGVAGAAMSGAYGAASSAALSTLSQVSGMMGSVSTVGFQFFVLPRAMQALTRFIDGFPHGSVVAKNLTRQVLSLGMPLAFVAKSGVSMNSAIVLLSQAVSWGKWFATEETITLGGERPTNADLIQRRQMHIVEEGDGFRFHYPVAHTGEDGSAQVLVASTLLEEPDASASQLHHELFYALKRADFDGRLASGYTLPRLAAQHVREQPGQQFGKYKDSVAARIEGLQNRAETAFQAVMDRVLIPVGNNLLLAKGSLWDPRSDGFKQSVAMTTAAASFAMFGMQGDWTSPDVMNLWSAFSAVAAGAVGYGVKRTGGSLTDAAFASAAAVPAANVAGSGASWLYGLTLGRLIGSSTSLADNQASGAEDLVDAAEDSSPLLIGPAPAPAPESFNPTLQAGVDTDAQSALPLAPTPTYEQEQHPGSPGLFCPVQRNPAVMEHGADVVLPASSESNGGAWMTCCAMGNGLWNCAKDAVRDPRVLAVGMYCLSSYVASMTGDTSAVSTSDLSALGGGDTCPVPPMF